MQEKTVNPVFKLPFRLGLFVSDSLFHVADKRFVRILFRVDFGLQDFPSALSLPEPVEAGKGGIRRMDTQVTLSIQ
jgi:hypothetical protein